MTGLGFLPKVVILDRDGTIVIDRHYLGDPAGLEFLPGAVEGIRRLHQAGCRLIVITNQSGIGRGLVSMRQVQSVNERLASMIAGIGAKLDAIYICPHVPEDMCACRKPRAALLLQAAAEFSFDPAAVVVIGDKLSDVQLGREVGARSMLIGGPENGNLLIKEREFLISGLDEAADIIESINL